MYSDFCGKGEVQANQNTRTDGLPGLGNKHEKVQEKDTHNLLLGTQSSA